MPAKQTSSDAQRKADFEYAQQLRRNLMRKISEKLELWRDCSDPACNRARCCRGNAHACFVGFMRQVPDEERREFRYAVEYRRDGLGVEEAERRARQRVAEETARCGA